MEFFKKNVCRQDIEMETPLQPSLSPEQTGVNEYDVPVEELGLPPTKYNLSIYYTCIHTYICMCICSK